LKVAVDRHLIAVANLIATWTIDSARTWFSGKATCLRYLAHVIGSPGDWLMTPTLANGQPAAAAYYRDDDRTHQALGVAVLDATSTGVTRITVFPGGPALVARFGLPRTHPGRGQ
jgi:RNA polymerase sigma-70 factor, ECF subfamily